MSIGQLPERLQFPECLENMSVMRAMAGTTEGRKVLLDYLEWIEGIREVTVDNIAVADRVIERLGDALAGLNA